jgi:pimeloyl-ACP methyl ester carboxylesterase
MALIMGASALVVIAIAAIAWMRRYPFETFTFFSRRALRKAGLERKEFGDIVYWIGGRGTETLALLHGTNDQAGTWSPVVPSLIERYRLLIPDLPGHGESAPSTGPLSIPQIAEGFAKLAESVTGDQPLNIVGNSMGGWIALLYSLEHPQKVKKLILEDSGGMSWDLSGVPLVPQTREQAAIAMRLVLGPKAELPPNYVLDAMVRRAMRMPMLRLIQSGAPQFAVDNRLADVTQPVTMIWGDGDGVLPIPYAKMMQSRIPNARLRIIDECGHIPHRQKPDRFLSLLHEAVSV